MGLAFWRDEKPPKDAQILAQAEQRLREQFADAVSSWRFRTRAFAPVSKDERVLAEWLVACRIGSSQWLVQRHVSLRLPLGGSDVAVQQKPYLDSQVVDFLRAVEILAAYEESQESLGCWMLCAQPDLPSLGLQHVRALAESEGIIFDTDGKPHPTAWDGTPLAAASFTEEALRKAKKAQAEKSLLPVTWAKKDNHNFRQLMLESAIMTSLYELREYTQKACEKGWSTENGEIKSLSKHFLEEARKKSPFLHICFNYYLPVLRERFHFLINNAPVPQKEAIELLTRHYSLFEFYVILNAARVAYEKKDQNIGKSGLSFDRSMRGHVKNKLAACLEEFSGARHIENALLEDFINKDKSTTYPQELDQIIGWFKEFFSADRTLPGAPLPKPFPVPGLTMK